MSEQEYRLTVLIGTGNTLIINGGAIEETKWLDVMKGNDEDTRDKALEIMATREHKGKPAGMLVRWKRNYKRKWSQDKTWHIKQEARQ